MWLDHGLNTGLFRLKYDLKIFVKYVTDLFLWCSTFDLPLYLYNMNVYAYYKYDYIYTPGGKNGWKPQMAKP